MDMDMNMQMGGFMAGWMVLWGLLAVALLVLAVVTPASATASTGPHPSSRARAAPGVAFSTRWSSPAAALWRSPATSSSAGVLQPQAQQQQHGAELGTDLDELLSGLSADEWQRPGLREQQPGEQVERDRRGRAGARRRTAAGQLHPRQLVRGQGLDTATTPTRVLHPTITVQQSSQPRRIRSHRAARRPVTSRRSST